MIVAHFHRSLTQRLSEQYLMYGLSGLFCFTITAIYLSLNGSLVNSIAAAVCIPLGLLVIGSFTLRRTSR